MTRIRRNALTSWLGKNAVAVLGTLLSTSLSAWALLSSHANAVRTQHLEMAATASDLRNRVATLRNSVQAKWVSLELLRDTPGSSADFEAKRVRLELNVVSDDLVADEKRLAEIEGRPPRSFPMARRYDWERPAPIRDLRVMEDQRVPGWAGIAPLLLLFTAVVIESVRTIRRAKAKVLAGP